MTSARMKWATSGASSGVRHILNPWHPTTTVCMAVKGSARLTPLADALVGAMRPCVHCQRLHESAQWMWDHRDRSMAQMVAAALQPERGSEAA